MFSMCRFLSHICKSYCDIVKSIIRLDKSICGNSDQHGFGSILLVILLCVWDLHFKVFSFAWQLKIIVMKYEIKKTSNQTRINLTYHFHLYLSIDLQESLNSTIFALYL